MEFDYIHELKGIKILDTNIFSLSESLILEIYDCQRTFEMPLEKIVKRIDFNRQCLELLLNSSIYSIPEVALEIEERTLKMDESLRHHSRNIPIHHGQKKYMQKENERKRVKRRRHNEEIHINRKAYLKEEPQKENPLDYLNILCQEGIKLAKKIHRKNIINGFTSQEKEAYSFLLKYFTYISKIPGVKIGHKNIKNIKKRNPCDFGTDEKLVATAMTLANTRTEQIHLVSSDHDLRRMLKFYSEDTEYRKQFGLDVYLRLPRLHAKYGIGSKLKKINPAL